MNRLGYMIGWWGAPSVWAINTQLGQTLPYADCVTQHSWSGLSTIVTLAMAIIATTWSTRRARLLFGTERFLVLSGSGISAIVAFAVMLQGIATLVIDPCLR
jgi:hypothetical protein